MITEADASAWLGRPVVLLGEGEWSRCFGDDEVVVRFGGHVSDFEKDRLAAGLGVRAPAVHRVEPAFGGWACVSDRVHGVPLESLDEDGWAAVLPDLERLLAELAAAEPPVDGFGLWERPEPTWRGYLDRVPAGRTPPWEAAVAASPEARRAFDAALPVLRSIEVPEVRHVVHADLLNRNVLVEGPRITGVFDWGCALVGDPRYERAGLELWRAWYPAMDAVLPPTPIDEPLRACLLHLGLEHVAYQAVGEHEALGWTAERTLSFL